MDAPAVRIVLEQLEALASDTDIRPALALVAGQDVRLDEDELHAARRRALLLLAAGGDPQRGLDLDGRAVSALAADLDANDRRAGLARGLSALGPAAGGLPAVEAALTSLLATADVAWRAFACALLADELAGVPDPAAELPRTRDPR